MKPIRLTFLAKGDRIPSHTHKFLCEGQMSMQGKMVEIIMQPLAHKRSCPQNAFYFGVVVPIIHQMFSDAGLVVSKDDVHDYLKIHVGRLVKNIRGLDGEVKEIPLSSTKLTTDQWENWITQIRVFAAENGVQVPMPNEGILYE